MSVRRAAGATAIAVVLLAAGCGGGEADDRGGREAAPNSAKSRTSDREIIRNWVSALNDGDFEMAARYFAPGAVVEQATETTLRGRDAAIRFNRSLPCRAEVTDFEDEGNTTLAAFRLREGHEGRCTEGGRARVRFVIDGGLIKEWRQLPEQPLTPNESA